METVQYAFYACMYIIIWKWIWVMKMFSTTVGLVRVAFCKSRYPDRPSFVWSRSQPLWDFPPRLFILLNVTENTITSPLLLPKYLSVSSLIPSTYSHLLLTWCMMVQPVFDSVHSVQISLLTYHLPLILLFLLLSCLLSSGCFLSGSVHHSHSSYAPPQAQPAPAHSWFFSNVTPCFPIVWFCFGRDMCFTATPPCQE